VTDKLISEKEDADQPGDPNTPSASIPLVARLSHEIPKPKDWQAFQRNCVLLFRAELDDPNTQEYGRGGQDQGGIDILGRRDGNPEHYVGIQCRLIAKPLKKEKILADCRAALQLEAGLKEIIFATTAPDDTHATDAAVEVEKTLRAEGYDLAVSVYGWGSLQTLIAIHEVAYAAFFPSIVATSAPQALVLQPDPEFAAQLATQLMEQFRQSGMALAPREVKPAESADEDPALHARIDAYRELFRDQGQPLLAEKNLAALLNREDLEGKPWARFRIKTNLGAVAIDLGREADAAEHFEAACLIRPNDSTAIANLALARIIQRRYEEAMDLARQALNTAPRADQAVAYLLQAAARSAWDGNPETLIPDDLVGSVEADLGLADFLRWRKSPGWEKRCLELSRRHPESPDLKRIRAIAVLSLMVEAGSIVPGTRGPVSVEELNEAADDMKAVAEQCLEIGYADQHDLVAHLNNAAVLLRLVGRHEETEALLKRALPRVPNEPQIRRLLALAQSANGRRGEALATLEADGDVENRLVAAELIAIDDPATALANILSIDSATLEPRLATLRWQFMGEIAFKLRDTEKLEEAIAGLRTVDPTGVFADLLEIRSQQKAGLDEASVHERLRALVGTLPADTEMVTRYLLAEELRRQGLAEEAASVLQGHIDLNRPGPATTLYLQSLAEARRDEAFRTAVAAAPAEVREQPEMLWTVAAHGWNVGDLPGAYDAVEALLRQQPDNARARLLKIEILVRQDRSAELLAELDKRIEDLAWTKLSDRFRVASLLGYFGYTERAAAFAYRLFLENRDKSPAWMTLSTLVLEEGRGEAKDEGLWHANVVAPDVAVDLRYDNGEELFLVVEPDASLRRLDNESWEPEHPLIQTLLGLPKCARFTDPSGREGTVHQLRHKYVARLHYVMQNHERRFPEIFGFRSVSVDVEKPGGLDELLAELKARKDWFKQEQEQYQNGPWPIGLLAQRLGLDTIEVADGLASQGIPLKVAIGNVPEREAAVRAVRGNGRKGCVLDLLAFWIAWTLKALEVIAATCGPIHLPQSVLDRLRARREEINSSAEDGLRSASYEAGKMVMHEVAPKVIQEWRDDVDNAIAWAEANATICPLVVNDELPVELRELLRAGRSDIFDGLVLAVQNHLLLVTDDLPTREFSRLVGGDGGVWSYIVFGIALEQKRIDFETYIRWTAHLIDAGHSYVGVSGAALVQALRMDADSGDAPGYYFKTLSRFIGGRGAEPRSHIVACIECLRILWKDNKALNYRKAATGLLLLQLLRERVDDYGIILRTILKYVQQLPDLVEYIFEWARGHFIADELDPKGAPQPKVPG
jgi:tetratricopeptide (TPR) repeat protein